MQNFTIHNLKKAKKNKEGTCFPFSFEVEKMRWEGYPTHIIAGAGIVLNEKEEVLLVKSYRSGQVFPGGQVEVGENMIETVKREIMEEAGVEIEAEEVCCITSNTKKKPGYNGVKEVPTKIILDFICKAKCGTPRPSDEDSESAYFPKDEVQHLIQEPAFIERYKAYLEYVTWPKFELKLKRYI